MTYHKPLLHALETDVLLASCCTPCNVPNDEGGTVPGGGQGGAVPVNPPGAPCYVSIGGICIF